MESHKFIHRKPVETVLLCGSRKIVPEMIDRVIKALEFAHKRLYVRIICGDANGIDTIVMRHACRLGLLDRVYGITDKPRNICCAEHEASYVKVPGNNFLARDRHMVDLADRVIGFCLNNSRGTMYTCQYAEDSGKPVGRCRWYTKEANRA